MRADLQRYYGLNLDGMGADYSCAHAAALLAHMPYGSALGMAVDPSQAWTSTDYLLRQIEYDLRVLSWQIAGDRGKQKPKPIPTPGDDARRARRLAHETPSRRAHVDAVLRASQGGVT